MPLLPGCLAAWLPALAATACLPTYLHVVYLAHQAVTPPSQNATSYIWEGIVIDYMVSYIHTRSLPKSILPPSLRVSLTINAPKSLSILL